MSLKSGKIITHFALHFKEVASQEKCRLLTYSVEDRPQPPGHGPLPGHVVFVTSVSSEPAHMLAAQLVLVKQCVHRPTVHTN